LRLLSRKAPSLRRHYPASSITPLPLARLDAPFEHPDWIFEPKLDGFRAVAYIEDGACRSVSRNRNAFRTFHTLAQVIGQQLAGRSDILDGGIEDPDGTDGRCSMSC
jgi:bifunctional non-homologous end joining protein LigD